MGGSPSTPRPATGGSTRTSPRARATGTTVHYRSFVSDKGEQKRYTFAPKDARDSTVWDLREQLRRSESVVGRRRREVSRGGAAGLFGPVRRALHQLRLRLFPVRDPWQRLPVRGAARDVRRRRTPRLRLGLRGRQHDRRRDARRHPRLARRAVSYETDASLFRESDYWQHPHTFEQLRRGDCEDFALWAWRKLVELGIDADLVIGRRVPPGAENSRHAWILFRDGDDEFLFEPDRSRSRRMPSDASRPSASEYIPEFGVARDRSRFLFAGYAYFLQNRHLGKVAASTGDRAELTRRGLTARD